MKFRFVIVFIYDFSNFNVCLLNYGMIVWLYGFLGGGVNCFKMVFEKDILISEMLI